MLLKKGSNSDQTSKSSGGFAILFHLNGPKCVPNSVFMACLLSLSNGYRRRTAVTVLRGLSAGAVSWSELASADGQQLQTPILPDHYQRLNDGSLVVSNHNQEQVEIQHYEIAQASDGSMTSINNGLGSAVGSLSLNAVF